MTARITTLLLLALAACGGQSSVSAQAESSRTIAQTASDPRTGDPTGATPAPTSNGIQLTSSTPAPSSTTPPSEPTTKSEEAPKKISARHVLIQWMGADKAAPSVVRTRDQARTVAEEVLRRARAGEDLARLAVEYSDEPGAGNRGGSLGRFGHGAMVPAFEEAAFKLKVGEVSGIVETGFGYHIIQRTE